MGKGNYSSDSGMVRYEALRKMEEDFARFVESLPDRLSRESKGILRKVGAKSMLPGEVPVHLAYKDSGGNSHYLRLGSEGQEIWVVPEVTGQLNRDSLQRKLEDVDYTPEDKPSREFKRFVSTGRVFGGEQGGPLSIKYFLSPSALKNYDVLGRVMWYHIRPLIRAIDEGK